MLDRSDFFAYQRRAVEFIKENPFCALWVDMGLGKTVSTLTAMQDLMREEFLVGRVLVIAPLRVARKTWTDELEEWAHLEGWTTSKILGTPAARKAAIEKDADLYLINRENVEWLVGQFMEPVKRKWTLTRPWKFDTVVIDESSSFKSARAKRFLSLKRVRPHIRRLVELTGTPSPKGLEDLWSQIYLLDQGERLGQHITAFRNRWFRPPNFGEYGFQPLPNAEKEIMDRIGDLVLTLRTEDYMELPPVMVNTIPVEMSNALKKQYREFKREAVLDLSDGGVITAANAGVLWGKLLQLANGAVYYGPDAWEVFHDLKIDALFETLESVNGPAIIVYNFRSDRARLIEAFRKARANFRVLKTEQDEILWNAGEVDYLLLHPASAGHGLNLHKSGAETIIHFGLNPSLELYQQVNARLAGGNRRKGKNVVLHHIITEGTVDERVVDILDGKEALQGALLEATKEIVEEETRG